MSESDKARDVYMKVKEIYEKCSKPCMKLDSEHKNSCLSTCDQKSRTYSDHFRHYQDGQQSVFFSEMFGVTYGEFVTGSSIWKN